MLCHTDGQRKGSDFPMKCLVYMLCGNNTWKFGELVYKLTRMLYCCQQDNQREFDTRSGDGLRTAVYQAHYTDFSIIFADIRTRLYRGDDKSLARPTSRCRMTDSIVSLERDVCSCPELQVFSRYGSRKEVSQATREFCRCSLFPPWPG